MSGTSSYVARKITGRIGEFADERELGYTFGQDCGYQCFPDAPTRMRRPDGSFVRMERISVEALEVGYLTVAPDLAVEVISPNGQAYELNQKIEESLRAGVRLIWVIDPLSRTAEVHRPHGADSRLRDGDELDEDVLPGFCCPVRDLFPQAAVRPTT